MFFTFSRIRTHRRCEYSLLEICRYVVVTLVLLGQTKTKAATPCCSWDGCLDCPSTFCSTNEATCIDTTGNLSQCGGSWCAQGSFAGVTEECVQDFGWESSACAAWLQAKELSSTDLTFYRGGVNLLNRSVFRQNLTQLTSFSLYQNDLTSIPNGTFSDLSNLQSLTISQNRRLWTVDSGSFDGLTSLRTLLLSTYAKIIAFVSSLCSRKVRSF